MSSADPLLSETHSGETGEPSLELTGLLHVLLRRSWVVAISATVFGLAAGAYVQRIPDLFQSKTVIQIEPQGAQPIPTKIERDDDLRDPVVMETIIQNFRNRSLLQRVAQELQLADDPQFLGRTGNLPASEAEVVSILRGSAVVAARPKTLLVDIAFTHPDPGIAQQLATTIVDQFLAQNTAQQLQQAESQNSLLVQKEAELKAKLQRSELAVQEYKNKLESVSVDAGRNLVESKLQGLNNNLTAARNERLRIESDFRLLQAVGGQDPARLLGITSVAADPQVAAAQARVAAAEAEILSLSDQFRAKHPRMIEAQNRLSQARAAESEMVLGAPDRVAAQYAGAIASEQTLEKAVGEQEKALLKLDEQITPYRALQQELQSDRALHDNVLQRLKETSLVLDVKPVNFRVVEPAVPGYRLPNRRLLIVLGAIFGGAVLAAAILAGLFFLNTSIKTVDDAERWLGLPVLSAIPTLRKQPTPSQSLALLDSPDSPVAESFRSLRTALSLLGPVEQRKVILFTSAVASEGKTLTAANAAIAFAQQGLRTIVLDADLRRPALSQLLAGQHGRCAGIAEYMIGEEAAILPTGIPNLSVLPAGAHAPNPAELLAGPRFAELVASMRQQYDRVVIDTAPVNVVSDTLNIVNAAQTVVLVVRNGRTPRKVVRRALELLARARVRPNGIALNFMPDWSGIASYYYYSSHSKYGSEETYGENYQPMAPPKPALSSAKSLASSVQV